MALAKTDASGGSGLLPEVLAFSSSLSLDRQLLKEDLLGSMAHVTMLGRTGVIPKADAKVIRDGLVELWKRDAAGTLVLPDEEDVHMAVEVELNRTIGAPAALLHSARSRNDQVATDLRLHVRDAVGGALTSLCGLIDELVARAKRDGALLLPSYTHRQRAQPISLGYWLASYGAAFLRDAQAFAFALDQADALALGSGAISGSSLGIDRDITRGLLGFSRLTLNGLDTVGERDFALDYLYATARFLVHASRLSTDFIDFTTSEFGFASLSGDISMGSSMMPQKKNPDVFELIRGKSGRAVGNLMGLLTTVKGLPGGYNRDLQEDRGPLLETRPLLHGVLSVLRLSLPHVTFHPERCRAGLDEGFTQATDLAEALVKKGMPFRVAYKHVGALVRKCQELGLPLTKATVELAKSIDPAIDAEALAVLEPSGAVARKLSAGSTGPKAVEAQLSALTSQASALAEKAKTVPGLTALFEQLAAAPI
ncbi:MAG: argininosuccinate lyase [Myxococcaceae bacterium]|nr:argininosuccinate lyase [Myxococcaceae bacterium]